MSGMSGALPEYQPSAQPHRSQQSQQRFAPGVAATIGLGFQPQPVAQFAGHASINTQGYPTYPPQYATPYQHAAATAAAQAYAQAQAQGSQHSRSGGPSPTHASYTPPSYFPSHQQQQFVYYPGQYGQGSQPQQGMQGHTGPPSTPYLRGPNHPYGQLPLQQQEGDLTAMGGKLPVYGNFVPGAPGSYNYGSAGPLTRPGDMPGKQRSVLVMMLSADSLCHQSAPKRDIHIQYGSHSVLSSRTASKAQTIWPCPLGRQPSFGSHGQRSQRPLLKGSHHVHRERVPHIEEQLCLCELSHRRSLCGRDDKIP